MRFGLKVRGVTVEPIDTAMRFEVCLLQNAPDTRTTHGPGSTLPQGGHQGVKTPACGWAVVRGWLPRCHRHDIETFCGGKAPGPTRARCILKATKAVLKIATAPTANGMAVTVELLGHLKIRRAVCCRRPQDQLTAKGQGLWCGMGTHD